MAERGGDDGLLARVIGMLAAAMGPLDRPSPSARSPFSPSSPTPRVYRAASVLALELGIGTVDDYEPAPPELCTVVTVQSKYDLLRLAGQKKRAEQDAQALRTRRRRPSFLPKELERIEIALKQQDAKRQQAAFLAPSWPPAGRRMTLRRRSTLLHGQGVSTEDGSNKTVTARCLHSPHHPSPWCYHYVYVSATPPLLYLTHYYTPFPSSLSAPTYHPATLSPSPFNYTHPHPRPQAIEQLRDTLVQHAARLADLFRQWDHWNEGSDGTVSKSAFRRAMVNVDLCVPRMAVRARSHT